MSTSILISNKSNIMTYRNSLNNGDSDKDSGVDSSVDYDGVNEAYGVKITYT